MVNLRAQWKTSLLQICGRPGKPAPIVKQVLITFSLLKNMLSPVERLGGFLPSCANFVQQVRDNTGCALFRV